MTERGLPSNSSCTSTLLVYDAAGSPPPSDATEILWRDFENVASPDAISIPRLIEASADELKKNYLNWIFELGEMNVKDQRLVDHLELRPEFSAWWMNLLVEKSYGKSPGIYETIRIMAFERWITNRSFNSLVLVSSSACLAECMSSLCARLGMTFKWQRQTSEVEKSSWLKYLYRCLPHPLQALIWLIRYLLQNWPLRGVGRAEWLKTKGQLTFVSYLFNLAPDAIKEGRFESRYWAHLPDDLQREEYKTNWLHLYVKDELLPNGAKAAEVIRQFNESGQGEQIHVTLDAFLDLGVVLMTFRDWLRIAWSGSLLHQAHSSSGVRLDLWPLMKEDWKRSMSGQTAISNALFLNLFESALRSLPKQRCGVYLQENQGWEFAFIHAWKTAGHGRLIGSPHSTVRYWDLRYFFDARSFSRDGRNKLPLPDKVALNGPAMLDAYRKGGYPIRDCEEVEALRYLHLDKFKVELDAVSPALNGAFRVLVLGDYLSSNTSQQMRLLERAAPCLPVGTTILVKPHPACPIQSTDYPGLTFEVKKAPIWKLLSECNVAYTSSMTSAAVDAYCAGASVVSMLDPNTLNLSPLRGRDGFLFASTPKELTHSLISAASLPKSIKGLQDFFTVDSNLVRWRKLLLEPIE